jgi:hypothetical protein
MDAGISGGRDEDAGCELGNAAEVWFVGQEFLQMG